MRCVRFPSDDDEVKITPSSPCDGKSKWVTRLSGLQVIPSQLQQLTEVQFKGGEDRVRLKDKRELRSFWLHACIFVDIMDVNKRIKRRKP